MRVVIINTLPWDSSLTKETVYYAKALSKSVEILLILREDCEWKKRKIFDENIKIVFVKIPRIFHPTNFHMVFKMVNSIIDFNPDIIHLRSASPWICFGMPFIYKYPIVYDFDAGQPREGEKEKIHYKIADLIITKFTNQIITFGQTTKEIITKRFKISSENIHVIPHGNYAEAYTQSNKNFRIYNDEFKYILLFGRIVEYKGLEYLIQSEPIIRDKIPNIKIIIAGPCDDFRYYQSIMNDINSYIVYNGWIQGKMITELFEKANVIVLPYTEYATSHNIQLAYAFKKPIVASDIGSISEYVKDGETGYLVPPRDYIKLAEALIKLLKDDELAKKMGENGLNLMNTVFSWDEIVFKTKKVYTRAIESNSNL